MRSTGNLLLALQNTHISKKRVKLSMKAGVEIRDTALA
jgi:hypothetical protein